MHDTVPSGYSVGNSASTSRGDLDETDDHLLTTAQRKAKDVVRCRQLLAL